LEPNYIGVIGADLSGTEMSGPLARIFNTANPYPGRKCQSFILTDGEDFYPDQVMTLVNQHSREIRYFTIGLGHGADPGVVKGLRLEQTVAMILRMTVLIFDQK
jgi:hypothetical protein